MRIAAIDIGTNSIHMVIASASGPEGFEVVDREREVVQVGRGSFESRRLRAESIRATVDALQRFVQLARRHQVERIICTATAAVREARNGGDFLAAARAAAGITPRVIPPAEEGRLIYLAVKSALKLDAKPALIVDIGGGSAQLVIGDRDRCQQVVSAPLGALRLTETVLDESDPPSRRDMQRLRRVIRKTMRDPLKTVIESKPTAVYGSSGSIHALAHIAHRMDHGEPIEHINGYVLSLDALRRVARKLQRMTVAEREKLPGIDTKRAEIIVPGAEVLLHILEAVDADGITISDYGVREGLVTDYITFHAQELSAISQIEDLRLRSVMQCLTKFQPNTVHPRHIAKLALALFDGMKSAHALGPEARELLHFAALLHDVGSVIGYDGHAEHSYYIIKNANLRGLTAEELERIANIARYHGKGRPRKRDPNFRALPKADRRMVRWLAAILRLAEGLDRSHYQLIRSLRVIRRGEVTSILVTAKREAQLELWGARRRIDLLAKLLGTRVRLGIDRAETKPGAEKGVADGKLAAAARGESGPPGRAEAATTAAAVSAIREELVRSARKAKRKPRARTATTAKAKDKVVVLPVRAR